MANLNDLDDVTISNPKVGDVVKYTAQGWANGADATGGGTGGNPCGSMDDFTQTDVAQTITEPWTWSIEDGEYGVKVEHQAGVNNLDEYSALYPGRVVVGNTNGSGELKTFDGGNTRLSALGNQLSFYDINNPDGVTLAELVACCDTDGSGGGSVGGSSTNSSILVNFPSAGVYINEQGTRAQSAWTPTSEGTYDPRWTNESFFDVFDYQANQQTVEMPAGTNAAVILLTYPVTITSTSQVADYTQGYANVTYQAVLSDNKGSLTVGPGALAAPVKLRTEIVGWNDAGGIGGGDANLQTRRTPGASANGSKVVRTSFTQSTVDSPTRLVIQPLCTINRTRACKTIIGSGRIIVLPYYNDGTGFQPTTFATNDEDLFEDDGGLEIAFEQATESHDLKQLMNYYTNAIRETLDYDDSLPDEGKPILTQALKDIFGLKQEQVDDLDYYYNRLDTIKSLVLPYVGFRFGFETEATTLSF